MSDDKSIDGKWVKSDNQKAWHFVEDFSFYDYPIDGAESICGVEYELNGVKNAQILSEVITQRPIRACNDCLNKIGDTKSKTYPDDFMV